VDLTPESAQQELLADFHWPKGTHPIEQASLWTDNILYPWQAELIRQVAMPKSRVIASTPNEAGKTSEIIPILGLSIMTAFPGSLVLSTAGSELQLKEQLFPYLETKLAKYPNWRVSQGSLTVIAPSVAGLRASKWIGYCPKDAKTAEGYHDAWARDVDGDLRFQPVFYIGDEAKSIKEGIFQAMMRIDPFFCFFVSTPGEDTGPFHDALEPDTLDMQGDGEDYWTYRKQVDWTECPHLQRPDKRVIREQIIKKFGEQSAFVQSMIFGKFYRKGQNYVFDDLGPVRACMGNMGHWIKGKRAAGLDLSAGGDEQVLYIREGTKIIFEDIQRERDTYRLAQLHVAALRKYGVAPEDVVVDVGGVGAPIVSHMESMGYYGMERYVVAEQAKDTNQFWNRYAEDHFHLRDLFNSALVTIKEDSLLLRQMRSRKYEIDDRNRIRMESKTKLANSPDRLDAMVMCFSNTDPVAALAPAAPQKHLWEKLQESFEDDEEQNSVFAPGLFCEE